MTGTENPARSTTRRNELAELRVGLWYDFRNPASAGRSFETFYREVLDQIVQAEQAGLESVWLTEHHFCEDGYTPSPLVLLAAIAERTSTMHLGTNLIVSPLPDPIRLAEGARSEEHTSELQSLM